MIHTAYSIATNGMPDRAMNPPSFYQQAVNACLKCGRELDDATALEDSRSLCWQHLPPEEAALVRTLRDLARSINVVRDSLAGNGGDRRLVVILEHQLNQMQDIGIDVAEIARESRREALTL